MTAISTYYIALTQCLCCPFSAFVSAHQLVCSHHKSI